MSACAAWTIMVMLALAVGVPGVVAAVGLMPAPDAPG
jgi:hypothetical protein